MLKRYELFRLKLSDRFVLVSLGLLLIVQLAGFIAARAVVRDQIETEVTQTLSVSSRIWQQLLSQAQERLHEGASVLASDFGFRSAVASGDELTIGSALLNSADRIGASIAFLLTPDKSLKSASVSMTESLAEEFESIYQDVGLSDDLGGSENGDELISLYNGQPTQFVLVPIRAPRIVGYVLMGFKIDQSRIDELNRLTGVQVILRTDDLRANVSTRIATADINSHGLDTLSVGTHPLVVDNEEYIAAHQAIAFTGGTIHLYLLGSLDAAEGAFTQLQLGLGLITFGGILFFAFSASWSARKITRPLEELTEATASIGQGNFDIDISGTDRTDEIGTLAKGFDQMRQDIQSQREKILHLAYFDQLTELPNRLRFIEMIQEGLAGAHGMESPIIVLTINLDRFKQVNDVLGYSMGDRLLQATAERIAMEIRRAGDRLARVAGDEFGVVLTRTDVEGAMLMARRIQFALSQPLELDGTQIDLSASIGIAALPSNAVEAETLVNASQLAMYAAKARSEDIVVYSSALETSAPENLNLLTELRRAVKENELRLFLQPKVETHSGRVIAAEALIRWEHPENGMVAPYKFVPFAEQTGFVRELTRWMVDQAARVWHELQPQGYSFRISVNLSTRDLLDPRLPEFLEVALTKYDIQPSALCLEITESAIMDDPKLAEETLNLLSNRGFRLSIDDFGTGYSSLGYLKRLPVNELKVDQSFVFGMMENQNDEIIVRSTIDLAHNLGLDVVAEGVETQAMFDALKALGCEEAQGYLIGKPMPVEEFKRWRDEWNSKQG